MKIYIAGAITGHELEERRKTFASVAKQITDLGHEAVNPMALDHNHDKQWESYMKECIKALMECDRIYSIHDQYLTKSKGYWVEYHLCHQVGIEQLVLMSDLEKL